METIEKRKCSKCNKDTGFTIELINGTITCLECFKNDVTTNHYDPAKEYKKAVKLLKGGIK